MNTYTLNIALAELKEVEEYYAHNYNDFAVASPLQPAQVNITKAEKVEQAYDDACWFANFSSEGCYREAVDTAHALGGIEVFNSNAGSRAYSFAPTRDFEFDDSSSVQVTYGGVFVILPNEPY